VGLHRRLSALQQGADQGGLHGRLGYGAGQQAGEQQIQDGLRDLVRLLEQAAQQLQHTALQQARVLVATINNAGTSLVKESELSRKPVMAG
jgi:hypothetical protein